VDYTSAKEKLLHSWHYNTLAVLKRHKNTYLNPLSFYQKH